MSSGYVKKRVLVTGGAGFIGSALCKFLVHDCQWSVAVIDKLTYAGNLTSLSELTPNPQFKFFRADICDASAVGAVISEFSPDAVMHLAAESHVDRSIDCAAPFVQTNIAGTGVLLDAACRHWEVLPTGRRNAFRFLHVSTDEIYGTAAPGTSFAEDSPLDPRSPYAASKASADHLVSAWCHSFGLPTIISNCSNNYGPHQLPEKLIPLTILNALAEEELPIYGDGQNVRDWLYVEDHVRALVTILTAGRVGQRYNVGARNERTNVELVGLLCDLVDRLSSKRSSRRLMTFVADRPGHDRRYAIDPTKIETELGWRPLTAFEAGLERTVRWYLENPQWWEPLRAKGIGTNRLGLRKTLETGP